MKTCLFHITLFICGIFHFTHLFGQFTFENPQVILEEKSWRKTVIEGDLGFIWLGTRNGLYRYDGSEFKIYKHIPDSLETILSSQINALASINNEVWIGTNQGISVLNVVSDQIRHYQLDEENKSEDIRNRYGNDITMIYVDLQKTIWIGTRSKGLWKYDRKTDDFKVYKYRGTKPLIEPSIGSVNSILDITQDIRNDSIIWAGTDAGLLRVDKYTGEFRYLHFNLDGTDAQIRYNIVRELYSAPNGKLYFGGYGVGITEMDTKTEEYTSLMFKNKDQNIYGILNISSIIPETADEIWITSNIGLHKYSISKREILQEKLNDNDADETYGCYLLDSDNRIWYSDRLGIQVYDPTIQQFYPSSYKELYSKDKSAFTHFIDYDSIVESIIIIPAQADGVFFYDAINDQWTKKAFKSSPKMTNGYLNIYEIDHKNGIYILGCQEGVFRFDIRGNQYLEDITPPVELKNYQYRSVLQDAVGDIWVSANGDGILRWRHQTRDWKLYSDELMLHTTDEFAFLEDLYEDTHGNIWFRRSGGIGLYLRASDEFRFFGFEANPDKSVRLLLDFEQTDGNSLWVAGYDNELGIIDTRQPLNGIQKKINLYSHGFDGTMVNMSKDASGNLWVATSKELIMVTENDSIVLKRFGFEYGAKNIDFSKFYIGPEDYMYLGSTNRIFITHPSALKGNTDYPIAYLNRIQVRQKDISLQGMMFGNGYLELNYNQNYFSFQYSAQSFTFGNNVKFRHRLEGLEEWSEPSYLRFANYTNIPPGEYTFQLQAANNEGVWNPNYLEIKVLVKNAWYLSWWFSGSMIIMVALMVYGIYLYNMRKIRREERLKSTYEKKLAGVEMSALVSQMNPHFLFNSLNSIDSYIIKNDSRTASEYLNNFARLMRITLNNSRSNLISLEEEIESLQLYLEMEQLRFTEKFRFHLDTKALNGVLKENIKVPPMLIQPFIENSIWHGLMHQDKNIAKVIIVKFMKSWERMEVIIEDNGIGRERAMEIKKQKATHHRKSAGMKITSDRLKMINKLYNLDVSLLIHDLKNPDGTAAGTRVNISFNIQ